MFKLLIGVSNFLTLYSIFNELGGRNECRLDFDFEVGNWN